MQSESAVIIHYHIFKNAGTSVDSALHKLFGSRWATYEGEHAHDVLSPESLRHFLSANKNIKAVSSHLARPPLPYDNSLPIVFLRHPILRAKSVYDFVRADSSQPGHEVVSRIDFREYIDAILTGRINGVVIKNYQVMHLSEASFRHVDILRSFATESDFEQAKALLAAWPAFGIVERYEESLELLSACYRDHLGGRDLPVSWLNQTQVGSRGTRSLEEQLTRVRESLGCVLYEALEEANNLDMRLYSWGGARFDEQSRRHIAGS